MISCEILSINRFTAGVPGDYISGNRKMTAILHRDVDGLYVHPIGLQVLIDSKKVRHEEWKIGLSNYVINTLHFAWHPKSFYEVSIALLIVV